MSRMPVVAVVDDSFAMREALSDLISSVGFQPDLYASGEEFIGNPARANADAIVVDYKMDGMTGLDLQLRLIEEGKCPPLIMITSYHDDRLRTAVISNGAIAFFPKPFDANELIALLNKTLSCDNPPLKPVRLP